MRAAIASIIVLLGACGARQTRPSDANGVVNERSPYEFHRALAQTLLKTHQPYRAESHARRMIELRPRSPEPRFLMARAYMDLGLLGEAERLAASAVRLQKSYHQAHSLLGVVADLRGQHRQAEAAYRRAIRLDPSSAGYWNNLGYTLFLQRRYREALDAYQAALARNARLRRIHNNIGFTFGLLGDLEGAYQSFRRAGDRAEADNNMGLMFEQRGELPSAYDSLVHAVLEDPNMMQARGNLERVCERLGRTMPSLPQAEAEAP